MLFRSLGLDFVVTFAVLLSGCATQQGNNLDGLKLLQDPIIQTYADPDHPVSHYKSFTVAPPKDAYGDKVKLSNEIEIKQLLFSLRNEFESLGYRFVGPNQNPELILTLDGVNEFKESYVSPQLVTVPEWVSARTITTNGRESGSVDASAIGPYGVVTGYGNYSAASSSTTQVSGYVTTKTVIRPGYTVGHYYPSITVQAFDTTAHAVIWTGAATGTSNHPDLRVSSQALLYKIISPLPGPSNPENLSRGSVGAFLQSITIDTNNYYPAIIRVVAKSPAKQSGLQFGDLIVAVDGISTRNKPVGEVRAAMRGEPGTQVRLKVARLRKVFEIGVTRAELGKP